MLSPARLDYGCLKNPAEKVRVENQKLTNYNASNDHTNLHKYSRKMSSELLNEYQPAREE